MFFNNNIKYRDILIFALIGVIGYKLIDNYDYFFSLLKKIVTIMTPFIYALICAYILNPVISFFERKLKVKRAISIAITYLMIVTLVFIILFFTIPSIIDSILNITKEVPKYVEIIQKWINTALQNERIKILIEQAGLLGKLQEMSGQIGNIAIVLLQGLVMYLLSFTSNLVIVIFGFLISIYVIVDKERLLKNTRRITYMIFKEENGNRIINFVRTYNKMVGFYIGIKAVDSSIVGIIALFGLLIVGEPYAPLIALIVGITNMIPYFGPLMGVIVAMTVAIFVSPMKAFVVFVLLLCIQQFDAWFLEPKLVGKKVGISPLGIILGVTIGGGFLGPIGMLLGSPTMATIKIYYEKLFSKFKDSNPRLVKEENLDDTKIGK
ncbi:putative PurR-regulated permease PerM [Clostridium saccharoperbutylacetonicum]|uniref:Putative permease n=1 Tax=Clostridium saccharoperbutylacetonicum N1-4(HMT) TaxID=931276 RepID=M1MET4_9CLOT|nr:AI-2E family transporter [Clostridium saccharoperbutylacetonicum]AGF54883.1 putative permease [Clostridium saccharoperbutylacetonicum N1-4(HMT)]NRT64412.1 putative PurR-regulated permease PerM [Clostridium saccharoperbutylacetonicum]NSB27782.1 putative PurR-regulated permease PerM [Clostridium saccharoperbutylacetonicum]NSB41268.1 putative PurR-regulated permease PerM [Clostridium saccharoperbutylacetonicum]